MLSDASLAVDADRKEKRGAAWSSVVAALFLTGMKLVVGLLTGSLGILAEAAHSGLDLVAAAVTLIAVSISDRPADDMHPYGHGKIENFSALIETVLLFITCAWIIYEAVERIFFRSVEVDPSFWAFLVVVVSIAIDVTRSRMLLRAARKHRSQALEADALHFSTDVWSSTVVIVGLTFVWLGRHVFPRQAAWLDKADAVAALGVAVLVLFVSYKLGKRTVDVLLDSAPDGLRDKIVAAAGAVEGVIKAGQVRLRRSGPQVFIDMTIEVDRNLTVERTDSIASGVEARIQGLVPGADVVVHTDPGEVERENLARRIRGIAERNQIPAHNISVHEDNGEIHVDLHIEVDDHLLLHQAHDLASHVEQDLRAEIPTLARVTTHIESRGTGVSTGRDVTAEEGPLVERIRTVTDGVAGRACCHSIVVRRLGDRLAVSLHCGFDRNLPVREAHRTSTRIEEALKAAVPEIEQVVVHTEPEQRPDGTR
ncbi:MAG TPA: cation-efflux pump [Candidatus Aminicenantes bacterium]|nr:cation-efflux pump [Candidatus Aminicenantes bacterium]HRY64933.1 cation-efflux pump [Candidatus Aminicenantes bacterium]HRZ71846.1 cation-efflux pump [Candidatus Aminicenantes bacterium]